MRRRALLGTLGTGAVSGCLGGFLDVLPDGPRFAIENDPVPDGLAAALSAELVEGRTADHPASLRVTFENAADRTRAVRTRYPFPFAEQIGRARHGDPRLVLEYDAPERRDGCWRTDSPYGSGSESGACHRASDGTWSGPSSATRTTTGVSRRGRADSRRPTRRTSGGIGGGSI